MSYSTTTSRNIVAGSLDTGTSKTTSNQQKKPALLMRWMLALLMIFTVGANAHFFKHYFHLYNIKWWNGISIWFIIEYRWGIGCHYAAVYFYLQRNKRKYDLHF